MRTYFASPERSTKNEIEESARRVSTDPILRTVLRLFGGIVAVLDRNRQIIAINNELLRTLGVEKTDDLLGLRLGEAFHCQNAGLAPSGCGTGEACADCGAVLAILLAQDKNEVTERDCFLITQNAESALDLRVRAMPIETEGARYVVLALSDIRDLKQRETLERLFLHDMGNILGGLIGTVELLPLTPVDQQPEMLDTVRVLANNIVDEMSAQRTLHEVQEQKYLLHTERRSVGMVLDRLQLIFRNHILTRKHILSLESRCRDQHIETDLNLLHRSLVNLVKNALEAAPEDSTVRVTALPREDGVHFEIWNMGEISEQVARKLFRRYASTKATAGRGLGLYSVRLFVEHFLGGKVSYVSSRRDGTTFRVWIPHRRISSLA